MLGRHTSQYLAYHCQIRTVLSQSKSRGNINSWPRFARLYAGRQWAIYSLWN